MIFLSRNWCLSYEDRLDKLELDSLFTRRKSSKLCLLYKMVHSLSVPCFPITPYVHRYTTRSHSLCLNSFYAHSTSFSNAYFNSAVKAWNKLPYAVVSSNSVATFKKSLQTLDLLPTFDFWFIIIPYLFKFAFLFSSTRVHLY